MSEQVRDEEREMWVRVWLVWEGGRSHNNNLDPDRIGGRDKATPLPLVESNMQDGLCFCMGPAANEGNEGENGRLASDW